MIIYCIACGDPIEAELPPYGIHVGRKCGCGCSMILTTGINNKIIITRDLGESIFGEIELANNSVYDMAGEFSFFGYLKEQDCIDTSYFTPPANSEFSETNFIELLDAWSENGLPEKRVEKLEWLLYSLEQQERFELCKIVYGRLNELKPKQNAFN